VAFDLEISKLRVNDRSRTDFGDVPDLAKSLQENGLINAITVHANTDGSYQLVAGERRLRAALLLGWRTIRAELDTEVTGNADISLLTPDVKRKALELEENLRRKDFTWPEEIACLAELHNLKQQLYGAPVGGTASGGWGIRETAALVGKTAGAVSQELKLANFLQHEPAILNSIKKLPMHAARRMVAQIVEKRQLDEQIKSRNLTLGIELRHGRCEQLIDALDDTSVDMLLTDPPFGSPGIVKASLSDTASYNLNSTNVGTVDTLWTCYQELFPKLAKKLKPGAHVYIFTGMGELYARQLLLLKACGFLIDELPLIWDKQMVSTIARDYHYMSCYQAIMFGHFKEATRSLWKPTRNIFNITAPAHQNRVHPLQLPRELLQHFIRNSTSPGHLVLDCFAGSGAVLDAARSLNRRAIGFELDDGNYTRALAWLQDSAPEADGTSADRSVPNG
jgi:DNA modification methylase